MLDFAKIKADIRIVDVLLRRGISLRYKGEWGSALCPLPTHKPGDKDKAFQVNVADNFFKCWSTSCNEKAGKRGGDVINLVALLDNISEFAAAQKLASEFHLETNKPGKHIAHRAEGDSKTGTSKGTKSKLTVPSVEVKGFMAEVDAWFDEMIARGDQESDESYIHRVRNAVKARLVQSFRNGKRVAQGLLPES